MSSIKVYAVIQEQLRRVHTESREAARWPDLPHMPPSRRTEALQLSAAAFGYLARGDALPFFRPHFLEISGALFNLTRRLTVILAFLSSLPPGERDGLGNLSSVFSSLNKVTDTFQRTWMSLDTDRKKAEKELQDTAAIISQIDDLAVQLPPRPATLFGALVDALYLVDLSLKKMIILLWI
jgi:hypothetical protein